MALPAGAKTFALGRTASTIAGMTAGPPGTAFTPERGYGITGGTPQAIGKGWPDALTGRGLGDPAGAPWSFAVAVPDGDYRVWLAGGMAIDPEALAPAYALHLAGTALYDDPPTPEQVFSEKDLYRFLVPW
jgi:hypothetical protein